MTWIAFICWVPCAGVWFVSFDSFAPERFQIYFRKIVLKLISVTDGCDISSKIALRWTSLDLNGDKSTLVQVMAWCHQATRHYLNQCWPRYLSSYGVTSPQWVDILRPSQNRRHFAGDIFECIFFNENSWSSLTISLKFVFKIRINDTPALVQIMTWRRPGDKPLFESMVVSLLTHTWVTRPQWVNVLVKMLHTVTYQNYISAIIL